MPPASLRSHRRRGLLRIPRAAIPEPVVTGRELTSPLPPPALLAQVLLDLASLPVPPEQTADATQHDPGHEHAEARAEHRPVEPVAARVVQQVDREPHEAEAQVDAHHRVEDPLPANPPASLLTLKVGIWRQGPPRVSSRSFMSPTLALAGGLDVDPRVRIVLRPWVEGCYGGAAPGVTTPWS